jgi:hypothetical protein
MTGQIEGKDNKDASSIHNRGEDANGHGLSLWSD